MEQIDLDGFDHIDLELTENEINELSNRAPTNVKLVICKVSTSDNIYREVKDVIRSESKKNVKWLSSLGKLLASLHDCDDDEIKALALELDAIDLVGWKIDDSSRN